MRKKAKEHYVTKKVQGSTYKKYDCEQLQEALIMQDWEAFFKLTEPSEMWSFIISAIEKYLDEMCPVRELIFKAFEKDWFNYEILDLIYQRRGAVNSFKGSGDVEDLNQAKTLRDRINNIMSNSVKARTVLDRLEEHRHNPNKFWKCINDLLKVKNSVHNFKLINEETEDVVTENETADYINDFFSGIGNKLYHAKVQNGLDPHTVLTGKLK